MSQPYDRVADGLNRGPRNRGLLTAWELRQHGVAHAVIADNAAGILLASEVGSMPLSSVPIALPQTAMSPPCGTYLKHWPPITPACLLRCRARSTIDFACPNGAAIPIEERDGDELRVVASVSDASTPATVRQLPNDEAVGNPAFDVTPTDLSARSLPSAAPPTSGQCRGRTPALSGQHE